MLLQRGKGLNHFLEVLFCPCRFGFFTCLLQLCFESVISCRILALQLEAGKKFAVVEDASINAFPKKLG